MEEENYIKEKVLSNSTRSVPLEALEILIPKTKISICKVNCNEGGNGTGFFCNIPDSWNTLKVLMTNNHVLNKDDISIGKKIKFSINNEMIFYEIEIDKSRKIYTDKKYDITIIEIKQEDKLDKITFFDLDDRIFNENPNLNDIIAKDSPNEIFKNMQIYLLHYPKGNKMEYSIGFIINVDNYTIRHSCDSAGGSSGGPIINSINFHVIGIHKGGAEGAKKYNLGTLLKEPINIFRDIYGNNQNENLKKEYLKENENNKNGKNEKNENIPIKSENENFINDVKIDNDNHNDNLINDEDTNEIIIQYTIKDKDFKNNKYPKYIKIFSNVFVKNNKDKCKIIIDENEFIIQKL